MEKQNGDHDFRVSDLLHQIQRVNEMIAIHDGDVAMQDQYRRLRTQFVDSLNSVMNEYEFELVDKAA